MKNLPRAGVEPTVRTSQGWKKLHSNAIAGMVSIRVHHTLQCVCPPNFTRNYDALFVLATVSLEK